MRFPLSFGPSALRHGHHLLRHQTTANQQARRSAPPSPATMRSTIAMLLPLLAVTMTMMACDVLSSGSSTVDPRPVPLSDEVLGLVVFKSGLADRSGALASWTEADATPCRWAHVQCDPTTGRVLRLGLDGLGLSGPLDLRPLARLTSLRELVMSNNKLAGNVPLGVSLLPSLRYLDLSLNSLSGTLPADLAGAAGLRYLDLSGNALTGTLPASMPPSLRVLMLGANMLDGEFPAALAQCTSLLHLNLSANRFSGDPDFARTLWPLSKLRVIDVSANLLRGAVPDGIAALRNLKTLDLSGNQFTGSLPSAIGLCPHLRSVDVGSNAFEGALPSSYRHLTSLTRLSAPGNRLSGEVPSWLSKLTALQYLDLSSNQLAGFLPESIGMLNDLNYMNLGDNQTAGVIPDVISDCSKLAELRLQGNRLSGSIPQSVFDMRLQVLDLSSNALTGAMPAGSSRLAGTLRWLDLSNNRLSGGIPAETALFFNLQYLNLSYNALHAQMPPELGLLRELSVLDLRSTSLLGSIPADICESGSLAVLQLDGNSLTGPIPAEIGNCSSLYFLSLAHNDLTGPIPSTMAELKKLKILRLECNSLVGEIPPQLGGLESLLAVNVSYNRFIGRLPSGGIFPSLEASALEGNLGVCSPLVTEPCRMNVPKPLVLNPDGYTRSGSTDDGVVSYDNGPVRRRRSFLSVSSIVAISAALLIVLGILVITMLNMSARRRMGVLENALESMCSSSTKSSTVGATGKIVVFGTRSGLRSEDIAGGAEALLSKSTEIGRGTFGTVYKASVAGGRAIAVKKLKTTSSEITYHQDFDREVRTLAKAKHPNVAPLRGYYWSPEMIMLLSEFAARGSLEDRLRCPSLPPLSWPERLNVIIGTAKGLAYLHQSFRPPVIHYNLKPSNILLDEHCNPRISDYGLDRLLPKLGSRFQGSTGYVAPELACQSLRINEKCDIYSFGALVLELVTGRRPVEYGDDNGVIVVLVDQVKAFLEEGNVTDCVDAAMGEDFPEEEVLPVLKLGLVCASQIPSNRPSMVEAVQILHVITTPVAHRLHA